MIIVFMAIIENIIENIIVNRPFIENDLSYECNMVTISKFDVTYKILNNDYIVVLISYAIVNVHLQHEKPK